ncbi:MAG: hypothetical protein DRP45_12155, partial [Candidatus Zixiibacteriota bacterium]
MRDDRVKSNSLLGVLSLLLMAIITLADSSLGVNPDRRVTVHNQGNIQLVINNRGIIAGNEFDDPVADPFSGDYVNACIYPRNSGLIYELYATLAVGGVVDGDTLASHREFNPDMAPFGAFEYQSLDINKREIMSTHARSELDIICHYYDTITSPALVWQGSCDVRHTPLNLRVLQRSMAWSGGSLDDFVLFDFVIQSTGNRVIDNVYIGFEISNMVTHESRKDDFGEYWGPLIGFLKDHSSLEGCGHKDKAEIVYIMDNDGDPVEGIFNRQSPLGAVGLMFLGSPDNDVKVSFNWKTWGD